MNPQIKKPDKNKALSLIEASRDEIRFTITLKPSNKSGSTIIRNIHESFRMLGDALLIAKGVKSQDHIRPIQELLNLKISTKRPLGILDNLRKLRHNINYYGYKPNLEEVKEAIQIAQDLFEPLFKETLRIINEL